MERISSNLQFKLNYNMNSQLKDKVIFILALFFMGVRVNLVGSISITELFVITQIPHLLKWSMRLKYPELRKISILFLLVFLGQCLSELFLRNSLINAAKGLAITFVAFFLMLFFLEKLLKKPSLIKWIPLVACIRLLILGDQFGFAEVDEMSYFKFYLAPIIVNVVCFISLYRYDISKRYGFPLFLGTGLFIIIGGARSLGFSMLFSALLLYLIQHIHTISLKRMLPSIIIATLVFHLFYANVYIPKLVSGEWGSDQNREQLAKINNSRNPLMMLFVARVDFYVSWQAFMDKPIFGHGSWAKDKNFAYYKLQMQLLSDKRNLKELPDDQLVPNHSVVVGMGTRNGIIPFVLFLIIFIQVYYMGFKSFYPKSIVNPYLAFTIISSSQHLLFGPPAILKNSGSIAIAVILTLYYIKYYYNEQNGKTEVL